MPFLAPFRMSQMASGWPAWQMTVAQPAAVAMRAAVSLVAMPPLAQAFTLLLVSACTPAALQASMCLGKACSQV